VSSFSSQNQSGPTSLSFHLHVISVFRLHEAVPPLHRAWCLGTRPTTFLGCDVMHCGRSTKFWRHLETAGPSEKLVPFCLISWRYITLVTDSSYSQLEEFWMSNVCGDTVSSELRTKQCRIFRLFFLLAEISTFLLCFCERERERRWNKRNNCVTLTTDLDHFSTEIYHTSSHSKFE